MCFPLRRDRALPLAMGVKGGKNVVCRCWSQVTKGERVETLPRGEVGKGRPGRPGKKGTVIKEGGEFQRTWKEALDREEKVDLGGEGRADLGQRWGLGKCQAVTGGRT